MSRTWSLAGKCTASHIHLDHLCLRPDIKIENVHRHPQRRARIGNIHKSRNMSLNRGAAQQQIDLIIIVPIAAKILNNPQTSLAIRNRRIQIMLLAVLINGEPFERQIPAGPELGFHRAGVEDGRLHPHLRHPVFDDCEIECYDARHLDGAAE